LYYTWAEAVDGRGKTVARQLQSTEVSPIDPPNGKRTVAISPWH